MRASHLRKSCERSLINAARRTTLPDCPIIDSHVLSKITRAANGAHLSADLTRGKHRYAEERRWLVLFKYKGEESTK
ncbi:hypothetical protein Y032_0182g904 [Ancylostoma ceylanicum]|uniref:Uncharacterized protein n=1 Tax=Ancylostoma ceylanicum TaxID=53326 RepID=A0A016SSE1_9BILA|nr:hypothetical protein Y032_0182g904 [Ancylostoma ceylanicum]